MTQTTTESPTIPLLETQRWMLTATTAPAGLPAGLARAAAVSPWRIEDVIQVPPGVDPRTRLDIYAQGYWLRLLACLKADHPALLRLLGDRMFDLFARGYLANHPPHSTSLYDLGAGLPRFLRRTQARAAAVAPAEVRRRLRFPVELAALERAGTEAMRAEGLEAAGAAPAVDIATLLLGGAVEVALPSTTRLLLLAHPFRAFRPWLTGETPESEPEPGRGYVAVGRHRFRCFHRELEDWQFFALRAVARQPCSLAACAAAAARRTGRPVAELLALLAVWLPAAQDMGLVKLGAPAAVGAQSPHMGA